VIAFRSTVTRRLRSDRGFSLPEVLVAAALTASALTSVAPLVALAAHADLASRLQTSAVLAAEQQQEALLSRVADGSLLAPAAGVESIDSTGRRVDGESTDATFTSQWWIEPHPAIAGATIVRVEVAPRVRMGRRPITVHLATIRYDTP
jgi:prepilin-type N-terminal cleavage/methylation domain-containing protein